MPKKHQPGCPCCNQGGDCRLAACGNCSIPRSDLTVAWANPIIGNGQAALIYSPPNQWQSACTNQLIYQILCTSNQVEFRVTYFISGSCPTGQSQFCSTLRPTPFRLQQTLLQCGAQFRLQASVTSQSCPNLSANGYTGWTITGPYEGQPPPKCLVCFTVTNICNGAIAGATVTVSGGPGPGGSGTTDSRGFVAIDIGQAGAYTVTVSASGYQTLVRSMALQCGKSYQLSLLLASPSQLTLSWTTLAPGGICPALGFTTPGPGSAPMNLINGTYYCAGSRTLPGCNSVPTWSAFLNCLATGKKTWGLDINDGLCSMAGARNTLVTLDASQATSYQTNPFLIVWNAPPGAGGGLGAWGGIYTSFTVSQ